MSSAGNTVSLNSLGMNQPSGFFNCQKMFYVEFVDAKERIDNTAINILAPKIKKRIESLKI
jgi:hypothetical protein